MGDFKLIINDGYCTWVYELDGDKNVSISQLAENAVKGTNLEIKDSYLKGKKQSRP